MLLKMETVVVREFATTEYYEVNDLDLTKYIENYRSGENIDIDAIDMDEFYADFEDVDKEPIFITEYKVGEYNFDFDGLADLAKRARHWNGFELNLVEDYEISHRDEVVYDNREGTL